MNDKTIPLFLPVSAGLALLAVVFNFICGLSIISILIYTAGSCFYALLVNIRSDIASNVDYVISGEMAGGMLFVITLLSFFSLSNVVLSLLLVFFMFLFNFIIDIILVRTNYERVIFGLILNIVLIIAGIFLVVSGSTVEKQQLLVFFAGYFNVMNLNIFFIIGLFAVFIFLAVIFLLVKPELQLHAQGKPFFITSGINNKVFSIFIYFLQSVITTIMVMSMGLFVLPKLIDITLKTLHNFRWAVVFSVIVYSQILFFLSSKVSSSIVLTAAFILPFVILFVSYLKMRIFNDSTK